MVSEKNKNYARLFGDKMWKVALICFGCMFYAKITGQYDADWWLVWIPVWGPTAVALAFLAAVFITAIIVVIVTAVIELSKSARKKGGKGIDD